MYVRDLLVFDALRLLLDAVVDVLELALLWRETTDPELLCINGVLKKDIVVFFECILRLAIDDCPW
jgi:hypothetical protein